MKTRLSIVVALAAVVGAFGMMRLPIPVRRRWQSKRKMFGIMGLVNYPQGRGELLRFRSGRQVGVDRVGGSGIVAGIADAVSERAAARRLTHFRMRYPTGVAETLAEGAVGQTETLWKPGDDVTEPIRLAA